MQPLIVWSQGVVFARIRLLAHLQLVPVAMVLTALHHLTALTQSYDEMTAAAHCIETTTAVFQTSDGTIKPSVTAGGTKVSTLLSTTAVIALCFGQAALHPSDHRRCIK